MKNETSIQKVKVQESFNSSHTIKKKRNHICIFYFLQSLSKWPCPKLDKHQHGCKNNASTNNQPKTKQVLKNHLIRLEIYGRAIIEGKWACTYQKCLVRAKKLAHKIKSLQGHHNTTYCIKIKLDPQSNFQLNFNHSYPLQNPV